MRKGESRRNGTIPIIFTVLLIGYGYWNVGHVVKTDYTIYTDKNIQEEGYKIAMIADLHYGATMHSEKIRKYSEEIQSEQPDMVVLCGDIVDERTTLSQIKEAIPILASIKNRYGTFYVYGNHDKSKYSANPNFTAEQLKDVLQDSGIKILRDENYRINDEFTIIGRDDLESHENGVRKNAEELLNGVDKKDFLLLLDHQPCELDEDSRAGYDLLLSGHTHGGQIWPIGPISNIVKLWRINYGYGKINDLQVIVSSGIAVWGAPIRTEHNSEYVIIDVKKN